MFKFITHFNEIKFKILYIIVGFFSTFITSYYFIPKIINLLSRTFFKFVKYEDYDFTFINVFEIFDIYLKLTFFMSVFFHIPVILYFIFSCAPLLLLLYLFSKPETKIIDKFYKECDLPRLKI